jgi:hypothetical protein
MRRVVLIGLEDQSTESLVQLGKSVRKRSAVRMADDSWQYCLGFAMAMSVRCKYRLEGLNEEKRWVVNVRDKIKNGC